MYLHAEGLLMLLFDHDNLPWKLIETYETGKISQLDMIYTCFMHLNTLRRSRRHLQLHYFILPRILIVDFVNFLRNV
jgi:hypothetical protein